jgi:hypothetical protein
VCGHLSIGGLALKVHSRKQQRWIILCNMDNLWINHNYKIFLIVSLVSRCSSYMFLLVSLACRITTDDIGTHTGSKQDYSPYY